MRSLRRGDIFALGFSLAMIVPTILGGAFLLWLAFARYGMGSIGLLLAAAWIYLGSRVLVAFVREYLEEDPPSVEAFKDLRMKNPAVGRYLASR